MALLQVEEASKYLKLLTGSADSVVTFQMFYDPKDGTKRPDLAAHFPAKLKQLTPTFERAERNHQGVYVCINETDGKGRDAHNVTKIRALFADFDGRTEPEWPLTPHFVTKRDDTHGHAYWLVADVEVDEFMYLQRRIAMCCDTDLQVIDPSRVARLCGTAHLKDPDNPKMYRVAVDNKLTGRYTKSQVIEHFSLTGEKLQKYEQWVASRESLGTGTGFEDNDLYRNKVIKFFTDNAEPAVEGSGTATLIRVVSYAHDHGLPLEIAQDLAWQYYNPRCVPPWSETERDHFDSVIERAYKYAKNEPGCRTAAAVFADIDLPPIPAPPPKKEAVEVVREGDRISAVSSDLMQPMLTAKSSHYELAQALDGKLFDGCKLIRSEKIWYKYNGKSWDIINDDSMKATVQRFYSRFKPSDTLVRGVYNSLSDLVNIEKIENGIWLDTGKRADNIICFGNGLIDVRDEKPTLMEHTPNFFSFNSVDFNYNPDAKCPRWIDFLNTVWGMADPDLILQLQEWLGYCMVTSTDFQKFALFIGKPRAGKGVITRVMADLVGQSNSCAPTLSNLIKDSVLHDMSTKRIGIMPDVHSVSNSNRDPILSNLKAITGHDYISFHVMYKGSHTHLFTIRLTMSTNNMPDFNDASGALAQRMLVFPFTKSFAGKEDSKLGEKLSGEMAGIAQWAIAGYHRLMKQGYFTEAKSGIEEKENIKAEMNPLSRFIEDVCVIDGESFVTGQKLYDYYLLWCKQHGMNMPLSQQKLYKTLRSSDLPIHYNRARVDGERLYGFTGMNVLKFPSVIGNK